MKIRAGLFIRLLFVVFFITAASQLPALNLIIIGPPGTLLVMEDGSEITIDAGGKYLISDLSAGGEVRFRADVTGRYPSDYVVEMGSTDKTYRLDPVPTGTVAAELKFTDAGVCPGIGFEIYPDPEDFYVSLDLYQSYLGFVPIFTGVPDENSSKYFMPMLGAGGYFLPHDFPLRINLGLSGGLMIGNNLPSIIFAAEVSVGLEFEFIEHYIIFAELNPRLLSPVAGGWSAYSDIFGTARSDSLLDLGAWGFMAFPSTIFGLKVKY